MDISIIIMVVIALISHISIIIIIIVISHISTVIIVVIVVAASLSVCLSLPLSLSSPNRSKQMAVHLEPSSVRGFCLLKGSFSLPLSQSARYRPALYVKCHEITFVLIWCYIKKMN